MDALKNVITSIVPMSDEEYSLMLPIINKIEVKRQGSFIARRNLPPHLFYRKWFFQDVLC